MLKETKIKIGEKEYLIKKTYRSLLEFEDITGKPVTEISETLKDMMILFYCIVKVNNQLELTFTEFVDLIDEHQEVLDLFNNYLIESATIIEESPIKKKSKVNR